MNLNYDDVNNEAERLINDSLSGNPKVTVKQFLNNDSENENALCDLIIKYLKEAQKRKDSVTLDSLLYLVFYFDLKSECFLDVFNELLTEKWHYKHEDLVRLIDAYRSERSVKYLQYAATMKLDYLTYEGDTTFALANKCIRALGNIGTDHAKQGLTQLSENDNKIISIKCQKQLKRFKK